MAQPIPQATWVAYLATGAADTDAAALAQFLTNNPGPGIPVAAADIAATAAAIVARVAAGVADPWNVPVLAPAGAGVPAGPVPPPVPAFVIPAAVAPAAVNAPQGLPLANPAALRPPGSVALAPIFDIRNGPANQAVSVFTRATIPMGTHWVPVANLPPDSAIAAVELFVRSAFGQLSAFPPPSMNAAAVRKMAICLGVGRAVMTGYYRIETVDLIPGERAEPIYEFVPGPPQQFRFAGAGPDAARRGHAEAFGPFTDEEQAVMSSLVHSMIGVLPVQGYSLVMSGHHYLSGQGEQSFRAFRAIEMQFWRAQAVSAWFTADMDVVRDACWHKSGHPVVIDLKLRLARDRETIKALERAGAGSAIARLPVMPAEVRVALTYEQLATNVHTAWARLGGRFMTTQLRALLAAFEYHDTVDAINQRSTVPGAPPPAMPAQPANMPPNCADLNQTLRTLAAHVASMQGAIAVAYGFYHASITTGATASAAQGDTLLNAYSLRKLPNQVGSAFRDGTDLYGDYKAFLADQRKRGRFNAVTSDF